MRARLKGAYPNRKNGRGEAPGFQGRGTNSAGERETGERKGNQKVDIDKETD